MLNIKKYKNIKNIKNIKKYKILNIKMRSINKTASLCHPGQTNKLVSLLITLSFFLFLLLLLFLLNFTFLLSSQT